MAQSQAQSQPRERKAPFAGWAGLGPWWSAVATFTALTAVFLGIETLLGRWSFLLSGPPDEAFGRNFRIVVVLNLLMATFPLALRLMTRGAQRNLAALRDQIPVDDDEWDRIADSLALPPLRKWWPAALLGVAMALTLPVINEPGLHVYDPSHWTVEMVWHRVLTPCIGWLAGRNVYLQLAIASRMSALSERLGPVDLFDLRALEPFARQGMIHVLSSMLYVAVFALLLVEWGFGVVFLLLALLTAAVAAGSLWLCLRGVRRRIHDAKRSELAACNRALAAIRSEPERAHEPEQLARIAGLAAYRREVESLPEWLLDVSSWGRFALYLLIPLGSWLGGALVERVVDALLR
jgi:hypothetical protein